MKKVISRITTPLNRPITTSPEDELNLHTDGELNTGDIIAEMITTETNIRWSNHESKQPSRYKVLHTFESFGYELTNLRCHRRQMEQPKRNATTATQTAFNIVSIKILKRRYIFVLLFVRISLYNFCKISCQITLVIQVLFFLNLSTGKFLFLKHFGCRYFSPQGICSFLYRFC